MLKSDAIYLRLFSIFSLSRHSKDFHNVIPKLYFYVIKYFVDLDIYVVWIKNISYGLINKHSVSFCMLLKENFKITPKNILVMHPEFLDMNMFKCK